MSDNIYERIQQTLTWKKIIAFNVVIFLVLIVPISVKLSDTSQENRSSAAEEAPIVIPPANYPTVPPKIERVSNFFGKTGDTVVLIGSNFGEYQWGSRVFIGNSEAPKEAIVRWSNTILEVKIPDAARTGSVWVNVNSQEAKWDGTMVLYDVSKAAKLGFQKVTGTTGKIYITNAAGTNRGMIEISHVSEPFIITPASGVTITSRADGADSLGKKVKITFEFTSPLPSSRVEIGEYSYPGIGSLEFIRAEIFDSSGRILPLFSDPLSIKVLP